MVDNIHGTENDHRADHNAEASPDGVVGIRGSGGKEIEDPPAGNSGKHTDQDLQRVFCPLTAQSLLRQLRGTPLIQEGCQTKKRQRDHAVDDQVGPPLPP